MPTFELLILSLEKLAKDLPHLKPWVDHDYWEMDNRDVYILAMCKSLISYFPNVVSYFDTVVDLATCLAWIKCAWDADHVMKAEELVLNTVCSFTIHCVFLQNQRPPDV